MKKPHKSTFDADDWHDRRCADSIPGFFDASLRVFPCGQKGDAPGERPSLSHTDGAASREGFFFSESLLYAFAVDGQLSFTPDATSSDAGGGLAVDGTRGEGEGHK